jgi:hypothetical protein
METDECLNEGRKGKTQNYERLEILPKVRQWAAMDGTPVGCVGRHTLEGMPIGGSVRSISPNLATGA